MKSPKLASPFQSIVISVLIGLMTAPPGAFSLPIPTHSSPASTPSEANPDAAPGASATNTAPCPPPTAGSSLKIVTQPPTTPDATITFRLQLECNSNCVAYVIQSSTNMTDWQKVLTVRSKPGEMIPLGDLQATNNAGFYRLEAFTPPVDTNPPTWSNGVNGSFSITPPASVLASWNAATDNFDVVEYRVYVNGQLATNVLGTTLSCPLSVNLHERADIRVQAVDASGNATAILSVAYLPGDKILAVVDDNGRVYVFQVQTDGNFSAARQIANFGQYDRGAGLGDFDRDGILDLIAGHGGDGSMRPFFFRGRGDGTFEAPVPLPTAAGANGYMMDAAVGDFDCDGNEDFVVGGNASYVFFYWGRGDGTFNLEVKDWGDYGRGMDAGDFNEDGRIDLVRANSSDAYLRIYLANGDRTFTQTSRLDRAGSDPYGVVVGDFDEDGHLDILANNSSTGDVTFFKGLGNGNFTNLGVNGVRANLDVGNYGAMDAFDYNGDGHLDLALVNYTGQAAYFWAGNGDGTFSANRLTLATGLGNPLGIAAPPLPSRVDVNIAPRNPVASPHEPFTFQAVGSGVTPNDLFRWTFGDEGTNSLTWNFNPSMANMGSTVAHTYAKEGRFLVRLRHTTTNGIHSCRGLWLTVDAAPPVARIVASTLHPEGLEPVTLSATNSTDDCGIVSYRWSFPPRQFDFAGTTIDRNQWNVANAVQNNKLTVTGQTSWGTSWFVARGPTLPRGSSIEGRIETPAGTSYAMVGMHSLNLNSGHYGQLAYAIYFYDDSSVYIYEYGNSRGVVGTYTRGSAYDFRIETKPGSGARYYLRPSGTGQPFAKIFESDNYTEEAFVVGADVYGGAFSFDDLRVTPISLRAELSDLVSLTGEVSLEVVDCTQQTNSTTVTLTPGSGAPPVAIIYGPTNGPSDVDLSFDAYFSSDDHAIARYTWNFGDGSPALFGTAVFHHYHNPGIYTNTLTVTDYAGQEGVATQVVQIAAGGTLACVPWQIIEGFELPHETYSGKQITLKAVARGVPLPFDYIWDFGDGTAPVTNTATTVTAAYGLEAKHIYHGVNKTPFYASVRIRLGGGEILSDTYLIVVMDKTLLVERKVAIDEGLWYLHKIQSRYDVDVNNKGSYWTYGAWNTFHLNVSASAIQAFGINGHLMTGDGTQDPYVETVQRGMNYLLTELTPISVGPQTYGDPDGNHNGIALYSPYIRPAYEVGPIMDAFVAAAKPGAIAPVGKANVKGRTLQDLMQDMVDYYCWSQSDHANSRGGGWRYGVNDQDSDNSVCQWAAIGFMAAERYWHVPVPQWVKDRNIVWLYYSQGGSGFGYGGPGDGEAQTPSGLVQVAADDLPTTHPLWIHGERFIANNWSWLMSLNNLYANFAMTKAFRGTLPVPTDKLAATGKDWFFDPANGLARVTIDRQLANGSWLGSGRGYDNDYQLSSAWSVIILSGLFQAPPVAVIQVKPNPTAVGFPTVFDASASYHQNPAFNVVEYRWDFNDADGVDFEHPDAMGVVVTNYFSARGTNVISLQVRDDATPQLNAVADVNVYVSIPPFPPTADAGGPYMVAVGEDLRLDGSGSFDIDAAVGDYVQAWAWDYKAPINYIDGIAGEFAVIAGGYAYAGKTNIGLRVTDATSIIYPGLPDMTGTDFADVFVYNRVITNLQARPKGNKCQLTWTKVGDYAAIMRSEVGFNRGYQEIGRTASTYATFLDTNIAYNVGYYYRILAYIDGRADPIGISDAEYAVSRPRTFDEGAPRFIGAPARDAQVGFIYEALPEVNNPCNDALSFTLLGGPSGMMVNPTNGLIRFIPRIEHLGDHGVSVRVVNRCGNDQLNFTLVVFPATNRPPLVVHNGPYTNQAGQTIQFSSNGSRDPEGSPMNYFWNFGDGVLSTNPNPTHVYNAVGEYTVSLFLNDGQGGTTPAFTQAKITQPNRAPVANAGRDRIVLVTQTVQLDGIASYDLDVNPLTYRWTFILRPTHSTATLVNAASSRPYFIVDRPGTYAVRLIVNDGTVDSAPNTVTIITVNSAPVAEAGPSRRVNQGELVQLDGSASYDVDFDPLTYHWSLLSRPTNSAAVLTNANTPQPSFGVDQPGAYRVQLIVNDGAVDSAPDTVRFSTGNLPPVITSVPPTNAVPGIAWRYNIIASDPFGDPDLIYTALSVPLGMTMDPYGHMVWTAAQAQLGSNYVALRVTDSEGASVDQTFAVYVGADVEPPQVTLSLVQGLIAESGQWAADLGSTAAFRVLATDNVGVTALSLRVGSQDVPLNASGGGSVTASQVGVHDVVATAMDAEGNVGVARNTIWFRNPNAVSHIAVLIESPTNNQAVTKPVPVIATLTNTSDLLSYRVDFALASDVDLDNLAIEGPQFTVITNAALPSGTREITSAVLAQFDPTILLNDAYVIRVVASDGNTMQYEGVLVSVTGNLKFGEFRLEFTDLSVAVAGIPITITRIYDTREAKRPSDFGYGWSLGMRDARIRESVPETASFRHGTRVYLNGPDGRRFGFTFDPYVANASLFGLLFRPRFNADAGVFEQLEVQDELFSFQGGGIIGEISEAFGVYNPSTYWLTTKDGTRYQYDQTLGLQNVTDLNGNRLVYTRDGIFHFSAGSSTPDQQVPFIRDAQGRITQIIDPAGNALNYTYDAAGDLRSFTDQVTNVTQYLYSTARPHYLTNIIDPLGRQALRMEYDASGRLLGIRDANGNLTSQEFPDPNTLIYKDANGHTNIVRYDDNGNEVLKAIPGISTNAFAFDANNNETWRQDARGFITTRAYDSRGNLTNIVDASGNTNVVTYNQFNKPTSVTDALGRATQFRSDNNGALTNIMNALGGQANLARDSQGRVASVTDFNGHTTTFDYTGGCSCGKPSRITNPDGTIRGFEYNGRGQTVVQTDELSRSTLFQYDDAGRLLWVRNPEGNTTRYAYTGNLKISETDPLGRTTHYAYDAANRQIAVTNAMGGVVSYEYDNGTNRTAVIDPVGNVTRFYYDEANRLTHQVDPWGHTNLFSYDAAGNRIEAVDRNGRKRTFGYDSQNRRTNELWWEGTNVVRSIDFTFNALGTMTSASDPASRMAFDFDALNRLARATQTGVTHLADFTLNYGYDGMTNLVSVADNWGVQVTSVYDTHKRLSQRTWQGGGLPGASLHFDYDDAGNRTNILRYSDIAGTVLAGQSRYGFSQVGLITNILHASGAGATLADYRYQRNAAQEITQRVLGGQTTDYGYDLTGQLTNALYSAGQPNEDYHYDANGNRIGGGCVVRTNNQIVADSTNTYSYDMEGSMVGRSNTATHVTTAYRYDHRNRLVSVVDKDAGGTVTQTVEFTYDALNRRIAKSVNGTVMRFLLNQENVWADANGSGVITARYLVGNRIDEMLARYRAGEAVVWYLSDNLGTVREVMSSSGTVINHIDYDTFGRVLAQSNLTLGDRFLFTGREWDSETGLCFNRARYYSPDLGRFISQDPVGFSAGDYNLYRYVGNQPTSFTDPMGNDLVGFALVIGALFGLMRAWMATKAPYDCPGVSPSGDMIVSAAAGFLVGATEGMITSFVGLVGVAYSIAGLFLGIGWGLTAMPYDYYMYQGTVDDLCGYARSLGL